MINLTYQERRVLIFLSFLFLVGLTLSFMKKTSGCNVCLLNIFSQKNPYGPVDINKATRQELVALPEIGEKTADAIIAYRASRGAVMDPEELKNIPGISDAKFNRLKSYFTERIP